MWKQTILETIPETWPCHHLEEEGVRSLFYAGVPYRGRETRVFAWLGLPEGASAEQKVPAVVLVHGGGGTAFADWVRLWNRRGYAAISMDTCGAMPPPNNQVKGGVEWPRHNWSGPKGWGGFDQMDGEPTDHWAYHAVNAVARGHSLLASLPEVDETRVGITGVSWGGVLTCLSASLDPRYRCAVPIYGCGHLTEDSSWLPNFAEMGAEQTAVWRNTWDPAAYLSQAACPMLWYNGTNDFAFFPSTWQKSAQLTAGESTLCLKLRWPHGHGPIGEELPELFAFMDAHLKNGEAYPRFVQTRSEARRLSATVDPTTRILVAHVMATFDAGPWPGRQWHTFSASWDVVSGRVTAEAPDGATAAFLQVMDQRRLYLSGPLTDFLS